YARARIAGGVDGRRGCSFVRAARTAPVRLNPRRRRDSGCDSFRIALYSPDVKMGWSHGELVEGFRILVVAVPRDVLPVQRFEANEEGRSRASGTKPRMYIPGSKWIRATRRFHNSQKALTLPSPGVPGEGSETAFTQRHTHRSHLLRTRGFMGSGSGSLRS